MQDSLSEFAVEKKVLQNPFVTSTSCTHYFTVSDRDIIQTNINMSEEISTDTSSKISSGFNFVSTEVLIYSTIIPESSRRKENDKENDEKVTKEKKKAENGENKKEEEEIEEERKEERNEEDEAKEEENVEREKEEQGEQNKDLSTTKKSRKKGFFNFFFRKNKEETQEEKSSVHSETEGHIEDEHVGEEHVGEEHVGEEHVGEGHVGEEHVGEGHVGERHVGEGHAGEEYVREDHLGEEYSDDEHGEIHVRDEHDGEDHIEEQIEERQIKEGSKRYSEDNDNSDEDSDESIVRSATASGGDAVGNEPVIEQIVERKPTSFFEEHSTIEEISSFQTVLTLLHSQDKRDSDELSYFPVPQAVRRDRLKLYFRRGFRPDNINLDGNVAFIPSHSAAPPAQKSLDEESKDDDTEMEEFQPVVYLSENEEPIDFLISLGFHIDEAALAIKEDEVKQRLRAALVEAKIWVKYLTVMEGTLILLLCQQITSFSMRFFLHMVEAIVNNRITSAHQIDAVFRALVKVDMGTIQQVKDTESIESLQTDGKETDRKQILTRFFLLYGIANEEAECKLNRRIGKQPTRLIEYLCVKYHPALRNHVDLIARYIGLGILRTRVQLDAAMLFCLRAAKKEIDIDDFELFCGFDEEDLESPSSDDEWWERELKESYGTMEANHVLDSRSSDIRPQSDTRESIHVLPLQLHSGGGPFASLAKSDGAIIQSFHMLPKHGIHHIRPSTDPAYSSDDFGADSSILSLGEDSSYLRNRAKELRIRSDPMKLSSFDEFPQNGSYLQSVRPYFQNQTETSSNDTSDYMLDIIHKRKAGMPISDMESKKLSSSVDPNKEFKDKHLLTGSHIFWSSESDRSLHSSDYRKYQGCKIVQKKRNVVFNNSYSDNQSTDIAIPTSEIWSQDIPYYPGVDSSSEVSSCKLKPETSSYTVISDGGTFSHVRDSVTQTNLDKMYTGIDVPLSRSSTDIQKHLKASYASESGSSWVTMSEDASVSKDSVVSSYEIVPSTKIDGTPTSECTSFSGTTGSPTDMRMSKSGSESPSTSWPFLSGYRKRANERAPAFEENSEFTGNSFSNISEYRDSDAPRSDYFKRISAVRSGSNRTGSSKSVTTTIKEKVSPRNIRVHTSSSAAPDHMNNKNYQNRRASSVDRSYPKYYDRRHSDELSDFDYDTKESRAIKNDARQYRGDIIESKTITNRDFDTSTKDKNGAVNDAGENSNDLTLSRIAMSSDFDHKTLKKSDLKHANQHVDTPMRSTTTITSDFDSSSNGRSKIHDAGHYSGELSDSITTPSGEFHHHTEDRSDLYDAGQQCDDLTESGTIVSSEFDHLSGTRSYLINDVRQHSGDGTDVNISDRTYSIEADSRTGILMNANDNRIENSRAATNHRRDIIQLSSDSEYHSAHEIIEKK